MKFSINLLKKLIGKQQLRICGKKLQGETFRIIRGKKECYIDQLIKCRILVWHG